MGAAQRIGRDLLELRRCFDPLGDESALALQADDQPLLLEPGVDGAHRVDVDPGPLGEAAEARQALAGSEAAGGDQRPQAPGQLQADRQLVVGIDRERVRLARGLLCH